MADTTFSDAIGTPIVSAWLNDVNTVTYKANSGITNAVARSLLSKLSDVVSVFDFMSTAQIADVKAGTHLVNIDTAFQTAVTNVCGAGKTLHLPAGVYVLGTAITFPNTSFKVMGEGPTATSISSSSSSTSQRLFDFTGCNGPMKMVASMAFNGKIGLGSASSIGIYCSAANGLVIHDIWFAGLSSACRKTNTSSYVDLVNCVFEYNTTGIEWDDGVECSIQNANFYSNVTDAYFTGDLDNLICDNWRCDNTNSYGIRMVGASNGRFGNVSFRQDGAAYTPDLIRMEGASINNAFCGLSTKGFGRVLIAMAGAATCTGNRFTEFRAAGAISAAFEIGAGNTNNSFTGGFIDGVGTGVVDAAGGNFYRDIQIRNCTSSGFLQSNCTDNDFSRVRMSGNTVDWVTSGSVPTTWVDVLDSTMAGLTSTRIGVRRAGVYGRTFYGTAAPSTLAYLRGDRVLNVTPTVGQPKAWMCTASGTPGTWVSEGNL